METVDGIMAGIAASAGLLLPILYSLLIAALFDTVSGVWAAYQSGNFKWSYIAEFVRSHVLFKITPIILQLALAVGVGGTDSALGVTLVTSGGLSAAAYLASVVASIGSNLQQGQAGTKVLPSGLK
jgi:hypothetical protein